jgi:hypothetical protein
MKLGMSCQLEVMILTQTFTLRELQLPCFYAFWKIEGELGKETYVSHRISKVYALEVVVGSPDPCRIGLFRRPP